MNIPLPFKPHVLAGMAAVDAFQPQEREGGKPLPSHSSLSNAWCWHVAQVWVVLRKGKPWTESLQEAGFYNLFQRNLKSKCFKAYLQKDAQC